MKSIYNKLILFLFALLSLPTLGTAQEQSSDELKFEVNRVYPYILVTKDSLKKAANLTDLNHRFKPSWVKTYLSVEILTSHAGKIVTTTNENASLSPEQKERINSSDIDSDIKVIVNYIPDNTLKHNEPKQFDFTFKLDPESEANYIGGQQQLVEYLKENAIDKIPSGSFEGYDLTAIKFTVNEEGAISDAHIFGAEYKNSPDDQIDALLLETIRKMPCWKPAEYANGTKVKQEFVLTVGNMENCVINLLNIQPDGRPRNGE